MSSPTTYGDARNGLIFRQHEQYHGFAIPLPNVQPRAGELPLAGCWRVVASDPAFALLAEDLAAFLRLMDVATSAGAGSSLRIQRDASLTKAFVADVAPDRVVLRAPDVSLAWRAVAWVERHMAFRHAPILPAGTHTIQPKFDLRITTSQFAHGFEDPADPLAYRDDYLRLMAHLGYSSFFLYINLWHFCRSELLPELSSERAELKRRQMRELAERAARFGLGLVLMVNAPRLDAEHPLFQRLPDLKGGIVMRGEGHALCTSQPLTHQFYAEQLGGLARDVPELAALAFLIGGEGFLHCYTRPVPRTPQVTNCPRCAQRRPAEVLPPLLNAITAAVKHVAPAMRVIFWPYSSYIWTTKRTEDHDWAEDIGVIGALDARASWLAEIEKDHVFELPGLGRTNISDYALHFPGPSSKYRVVKPEMDRRGIELVNKTETNLDASFHSVPYIPAMQLWAARQRAIHSTAAPVSWETWRFNGLWDSPSVELAMWLDLEPQLSDEEALRRVAARLYGPAAAEQVVAAWAELSEGWKTVYRQYGQYWIGPLVLGPAHLFDRGDAFHGPWQYGPGFFEVPAGLRESEKPEFLADPRHLSPRFVIGPMAHVPERLRDLGRAAEHARRATEMIETALELVPEPLRAAARADADILVMTWIILEEDVAFHRWVQARDQFRYLSVSDPRRRELALATTPILEEALIRARRALEIVQRTPFIGWGYTFGTRFTAGMIEEKIHHTETQLALQRAGQF